MSRCEHKTEEEYGLCNKCRAFERIARDARRLLQARKAYLDMLLVPKSPKDQAQEALSEATKRLEESVKFADDHKLWKCPCGCCHAVDHGACDAFEAGANGRCVYCDHGKECHPGKGKYFNGPLEPGVRET